MFELTVQFHEVRPENEPIGETLTFLVSENGFYDSAVAGGKGERAEPLTVDSVAAEIAQRFDRRVVERVFVHFADVREALAMQ